MAPEKKGKRVTKGSGICGRKGIKALKKAIRRCWNVFIRGVGEGWAARAWAVFGASRSEEAVRVKRFGGCA
jgi:hypothetical protein